MGGVKSKQNCSLMAKSRLGVKFHSGIYRWHLPVFHGMANKAQVGNAGKYNFFAKYWQIIMPNMIFSCKMQQISLGS